MMPQLSVAGLTTTAPGAVAEEHAGGAIGVIDDARHDVGTNGERVPMRSRADHVRGRRQRVGKPRACGTQIEAPGVVRADLVLDEAGRARKHHVRRRRAHDDEVDVLGRESRLRDRPERRLLREIGGRHAGIDDVALTNACALKNPLIGRVDQLLEILVGEQTRRDVGREAADFRRTIAGVLHHKPLPGAVNPK